MPTSDVAKKCPPPPPLSLSVGGYMVERQQVPGKLIQTLTCRRHAVISLAKIIPPVDPTCAKVRALTVLA